MNIIINDKNGKKIGELMFASVEDVKQYISKGFIVIERETNEQITEELLLSRVGVSECVL